MKALKRLPKDITLLTIEVIPNVTKIIRSHTNTIKYYISGGLIKRSYYAKANIDDPIMNWSQERYYKITSKEMHNEEENTKLVLNILRDCGYEYNEQEQKQLPL